MTLVIALEGADGAGKSSCVDRVAHMVRGVAFHHDAIRGRDALDAARGYREQRRCVVGWRGRVIVADRWWLSTLALSHIAQAGVDTLAASVALDGSHDRIAAYARALRQCALDERDEEQAAGVRVVTVYLRASLDTLRARTSESRRGGARWRALPETHAAYETLAPLWCEHVVNAEQTAECVAADVALIAQRERLKWQTGK